MPMPMSTPQRIVCLTEETVETLYLLGAESLIAGVTGYAVRPPRVRREKPRVGAFTSADAEKIAALGPDLVLTFSDLQADIAADLIRRGLQVHAFNQRTVAGILDMIGTLGRLVDRTGEAERLVASLMLGLDRARERGLRRGQRPRVYIEEWDEPMISGIGWVSELVGLAGGEDVFADRARHPGARERIVTSEAVIEAAPDLVIASWCGKKVVPARIAARPGWAGVPAVARGAIVEIKSPLLLAPGPAVLTDGLAAIEAALDRAAGLAAAA
jgi:iron complex transport system substrate-binding protein